MKINQRVQNLLASVHDRFIEEVGPVGDVLIHDAMLMFEQKSWDNPTTVRRYTKELANNIEDNVLRTRFLDDVGALLLASEAGNRI